MTLGKARTSRGEHGIVANTVVLVFVVPWKANFLLEVSEWMKVPKTSNVEIDVGVVELLPSYKY
jgi:hypothetical protein